jgi:hypothetical protein
MSECKHVAKVMTLKPSDLFRQNYGRFKAGWKIPRGFGERGHVAALQKAGAPFDDIKPYAATNIKFTA